MREKTVETYARELKDALAKKYSEYDITLEAQVQTAAMNRWMIVRLHKELQNGSLTTIAVGSMGQQKTELNPLLVTYNNYQRTYIQQLAALGLNKLSEKKTEATEAKKEADNPWVAFNKQIQ